MKLTYTTQGDYLLPNLEVPEAPKVGKYGMLRRSFLRNHRKALYTGMMLADKLNAHLEEVDRQANIIPVYSAFLWFSRKLRRSIPYLPTFGASGTSRFGSR